MMQKTEKIIYRLVRNFLIMRIAGCFGTEKLQYHTV